MVWIVVDCDISLAAASRVVLAVKVQIKLLLVLNSACLAQLGILTILSLLLILSRLAFSLAAYQPFWRNSSQFRTFGLVEQFLGNHSFPTLITQ